MSTPSYRTFVQRHHSSRVQRHAEAEQIATPAPDWIDLLARGLVDAISAPLRLNRSRPERPVPDRNGEGRTGSVTD